MVSCIDVAGVAVWETSKVRQHSNLHSTMDHFCGCTSTCYNRRHSRYCRFCQSHWRDKNCDTVCCRLSGSKTRSISLTNEVRHSCGSIHTSRADAEERQSMNISLVSDWIVRGQSAQTLPRNIVAL